MSNDAALVLLYGLKDNINTMLQRLPLIIWRN